MDLPKSTLTKNQTIIRSAVLGKERLEVQIHHDDDCGNGHNSFTITANLYEYVGNRWGWRAGGCLHDEVARFFPDLDPYLKWHLCSTDGPMHYLANTLYHAGDRDCWGKRAGEPRSYKTHLQFETAPGVYFPITYPVNKTFAEFLKKQRVQQKGLTVVEFSHKREPETFGKKYTFEGYGAEWHECPFGTRQEAEAFQAALTRYDWEIVYVPHLFGEGKEPELEAARRSAIWPEATLEQLRDEEQLKARLPGLMKEFKAAVESLGLTY